MPGLMMGRRYKNAPIVQAIVEFHVTTPEDLSYGDLAAIQFGGAYDAPTPIYNVEGQFHFEGDEFSHEARESQVGLSFVSRDPARTIHASDHNFVFMWLTQYTDWDDFIGEAERAWLTYREAAAPETLTRIGVRFVNHIKLPTHPVEIKDYLRTSVDIPAYLPQLVNSLFMQVEIPLQEQDADATVTSALLDPRPEAPGGGLLLDIDVKTAVVAGNTSDPGFTEQISTTLDRLRLAKNYVFEACITDATRGLIS